ncbi:MAG: hypothetical protein Q9226_008039 [Calogaya cf. arnoldii]
MPGRSAAIILIFIIHTLAYTIDDSFDVQDSCTPDQRKLLNQFVTETLELIDTAVVGIQNFKIGKDDDKIMEQNLLMYFKAVKSQANRNPNIVQTLMRQVKEFLEGTRKAFGGGKARLYCSSKMWHQKQPGDVVQDASGQPIPDKTVRDLYGRLLKVVKGKQQYAYWSDDYKTYELGDDTQLEFYCDDQDFLAVTDTADDIRPVYMIMCPSSFSLAPGNNFPRTAALGDTRPRKGQILNELQTRSLTFFHEVIHVVRSSQATTRGGQKDLEYYGCPDIMEFAQEDQVGSRKNPDNYVFFALSYWYWQNRKYRDDNSADLAADDEPGVKYNFVDCSANEVAVPN